MKKIETINRFNNGRGGLSVIIRQETGRLGMGGVEEVKELGVLLARNEALEHGIEVLQKAVDLPANLEASIRALYNGKKI